MTVANSRFNMVNKIANNVALIIAAIWPLRVGAVGLGGLRRVKRDQALAKTGDSVYKTF